MNLVLFELPELGRPLPRSDRRAAHVINVLRRGVGEPFDAGIFNGALGKGAISHLDANSVVFAFTPSETQPAPAREPIRLIIGLPRPQTARDVLREATALGVDALHFVATDKGEPSYSQSSLWTSEEWKRQVVAGAEQAFATQLPTVTQGRPLTAVLADTTGDATRIALDNYESTARLGVIDVASAPACMLAIGPERGWSARERDALRAAGFRFAHLGPRVLRTETAVIAAVSLIRGRLGLM